jgi:hypothetical protein
VILKQVDIALAETLHTGQAISWQGELARRTYEKDGISRPCSKLSSPELAQS